MPKKECSIKDQRLVARPDPDTRDLIEKAADLSGKSVSEFIIHAALKEAELVNEMMAPIRVSTETADRMLELLDNPRPLTPAMREAALNHVKVRARRVQ